jgi:hypothetical protein
VATSPIKASRPWTTEEDANLAQMRGEGVSWDIIAETIGKPRTTCRERFAKLEKTHVEENWSQENDEAFKAAYQKKKGDMWAILANEMGFQGNWRILEGKAGKLLIFGKK